MWRVVYLLRLENNVHPLLGIVAGFFIATASNFLHLVVMLITFVCLHSIVTIWNDLEDEAVDRKNGRHDIDWLRGRGKLWAVWMAMVILAGGAFAGLLLLPLYVFLAAAIFVFLSWIYNAKPIQASRRPIASMLVMWATLGVVPVGMGVLLGQPSILAMAFVASWSLLRLSLSFLKDFKDAHGDAQSHKRTFLLVYGRTAVLRASLLFAVLGVIGTTVCTYSATESPLVVLVLLLGIYMLYERHRMMNLLRYLELQGAFIQSLKLQALYDAMVVVCLSTLVPFS